MELPTVIIKSLSKLFLSVVPPVNVLHHSQWFPRNIQEWCINRGRDQLGLLTFVFSIWPAKRRLKLLHHGWSILALKTTKVWAFFVKIQHYQSLIVVKPTFSHICRFLLIFLCPRKFVEIWRLTAVFSNDYVILFFFFFLIMFLGSSRSE